MQNARRDLRGFVLIVVAVCGIAMVVIAMAVVVTSGAGRLNAIKDVATDRSVTIAESGLQRATAYANVVISVEKDLDRALDPSLTVNCASPGSPIAPGTPRYNDAGTSTVEWPAGSGFNYRVVPFNGGAYLTRFDDDFDDMVPNGQLGAFSSNNPVNGCNEGPGVVSNPYRDRNRAAWITVVGIYPGTDPAVAKHRTTLRRFFIASASTPASLLRVGGSMSTGHLKFCAETGDIAVYGSATVSNQTDTCGTLQVQGTITNASQPADCSGYGLSCAHGGDTAGIVFPAPGTLSVPAATSPEWFTWTSGCNFLVDPSGLYFWNAAAPACASFSGAPPAASDTCWIPLIYVNGAAARNSLGWPSVSEPTATRAEFRPTASNSATLLALPAVGPQSGRTFAAAPTHVLWNTCQGASSYTWRPGGGGTSVACANCSTGAARAMSYDGGSFNFDPGDPEAVPAGVYYIPSGYSFTGMGMGLPGTDANESDWPQATFIVNGAATFSGSGRIGIGTRQGSGPPTTDPRVDYPSLVVDGTLGITPGSSWAFGGAVWVRGSASYASGSNVESYGPLTVGGALTVGTGGKLDVVVTTDMVLPTAASVAVAATGSRTLR